MEKIIRHRCTGKTTELIKLSAQHNIVIVCPNREMAQETQQMAKDMKLVIPTPLSVEEFMRGKTNGYRFKSILIDELGMDAQKLFGVNVFAYTLSLPETEETDNLMDDVCNISENVVGTVKHTKSPLGLMPRKYWIAERIRDIALAISRYAEQSKCIPIEWLEEYNKLAEELTNAT